MNNAISINSRHEISNNANAFSRVNGALYKSANAALSRADIVGTFSLVDRNPVHIGTVPGMILHVGSGTISITQAGDNYIREVRTGTIADRDGVLVVRARAGSSWRSISPRRNVPPLDQAMGRVRDLLQCLLVF